MLARAWMTAARLRRRLSGAAAAPPREELVRRHAAGRSFADVGCMWGVSGALAFAAEDAGATRVSGVDVMAATPEYLAEHARRGSAMRLVRGDLHDAAVLAELGVHDVVWCSGVIYHAPHPLLTLERLRDVTGELLILASETIPEVPGLPQACVFYPGLSAAQRAVFTQGRPGRHVGLSTEFDPARGYANWYWGIAPSALEGMLGAVGLEVVERHLTPLHTTLVARRTDATPVPVGHDYPS